MRRLHPALSVVVALAIAFVPVSGVNAQRKRPIQPIVFAAPAGDRAAGVPSAADVFEPTLPSGRFLRPSGTSVVVGTNALGFALSPDGRFAIVANGDERAGSSLAVVDTASMSVVSRYADPADSFFAGVVAFADPANPANTLVLASGGPSNVVYALDLDASGTLTPDAHPPIAIPPPADVRFANAGHAYPATLVLGPGDTRAYVVNGAGNDVAQIDTAARALAGPSAPVGFFPYGAAVTASGLLVANEGLMAYGVLPAPTAAPPFATVAPDLVHASSLSLVPLAGDGSLAPESASAASIPLDRGPDGVRSIGGAHPAAIVSLKRRPLAFVALSNVDRVATISLAPGAPRAVGGTELRLYDRGPYGTQPTALALAKSEKRLYVALAGIDAVAVLDTTDPLHPHRVGLIPTGWYPDALALSGDEHYLFVANADGMTADGNRWSTFERIDLRKTDLRRSTPVALAALRRLVQPRAANPIVPQRFSSRGSTAIKHVVLILAGSETYDALFGDLTDRTGASYGPGDPTLVTAGEAVTPNLHALARTYGLAGNFYAEGDADTGHQFALGGIASAYTERTSLAPNGRGPATDANEDPEDYPRAGYVWNSLADHGRTYRDYGDLLSVAGYSAGSYPLDVPAPAALLGHVDPAYPPLGPRTRDSTRAQEFVRDFTQLAQTDTVPDFTEVWLPGDAAAPDDAADGDRAVGTIVDFLSHSAQWNDMAIVVMPASAGSARDHVDARRTYAIVVSPYAKRHYLGTHHLSTVGVLKTEEEVFGLPALSLGDELATDMSDFFTPVADRTPFEHVDRPAVPGGAGHSAPNRR